MVDGAEVEVTRMGRMIQQMQSLVTSAGDQGKSFKTKSVRKNLEVHVQKGSPDVQKTVLRETADMHPDADSDCVFATTESELAVFSGTAADS